MRTIHIEGEADKIDLAGFLSDNYDLDLSFSYEEETTDTIPDVFIRFYESEEPCSLEEAMKGHLSKLFGKLEATGQDYGYSDKKPLPLSP